MDSEEHGKPFWQAGDLVAAGTYLRVDDQSYRRIVLEQPGQLPASYDGHVAFYCQAPLVCPVSGRADSGRGFNQDEGSQTK